MRNHAQILLQERRLHRGDEAAPTTMNYFSRKFKKNPDEMKMCKGLQNLANW